MSDKKDLTRIEDLSEFLHQDDPDVDKLFHEEDKQTPPEDLPSLDDLEEDDSETFTQPPAHFGSPEQQDDQESDLSSLSDLEEDKESLFEATQESVESEAFSENPTEDENQWGMQEDTLEEGESNEEAFSFEGHDFSDESDTQETASDDFSLQEDWDSPEEVQAQSDSEIESDFEQLPEENFDNEIDEKTKLENSQIEVSLTYEAPSQLDSYNDLPSSFTPSVQPTARATPPENFQDIKDFAKNMSYGKMVASGNPPYSLILKNIKFQEDADDILIILSEHGLIDEQNEAAYQQSLQNGALLISQLSEYSAIYLAHRIRRFDLDLLVGLSEELHPSKSYESGGKGLMRKENLRQNKTESIDLTLSPKTPEQVLVTTTPTIEGHRIQRYIGILTEHTLVREDELELLHAQRVNQVESHQISKEIEQIKKEIEGAENEWPETRVFGIKEIYDQLTEQLKAEAIKVRANALVGITFHLNPLVEKTEGHLINTYKVTCTASAVWVSKSGD